MSCLLTAAHSPPPIDGLDSVLFRNCDQRRNDSGFAQAGLPTRGNFD